MRIGGKLIAIIVLATVILAIYIGYQVLVNRSARQELQAAEEALELRDFVNASKHLDKCLTYWPDDNSVRLMAVQTARRRGDFAEARRQLEIHKQNAGPETDRSQEMALMAIQQGNARGADELLEKCFSIPNLPNAHLILEVVIEQKVNALEAAYNDGRTLLEGPFGRDRELAERGLEMWFGRRPGRADEVAGLIWRGRIRQLIDQLAASSDFRRALELDSNHFDARLQLAISLAEYDPKEAAWHLDLLWRRDPTRNDVGTLLASFRRNLGQFAEGKAILDQVLAADPQHYSALVERGKIALDMGRADDAKPFLLRALARSPNEPFVHLALSRCLHLLGDETGAKQHQSRYSAIESERVLAEQMRAESGRAWRAKMERKALNGKRTAGGF